MDTNANRILGMNSHRFYRVFRLVTGGLLIVTLMIAVPSYFSYIYKVDSEYPCKLNLSIPLLNPQTLPNGTVIDNEVLYNPGQYFTASLNDNVTMRGCICQLKPCIRKCCDEGKVYMKTGKEKKATCQQPDLPYHLFDNFNIPIYDSFWQKTNASGDHFWLLYGDPCPIGKYQVYSDERNLLMIDGRISIDGMVGPEFRDASQYCLEGMNGRDIKTLVCFDEMESAEDRVTFIIYSTFMIVSIPFMLATVVVYGFVSELRNLHGKCLMSHSVILCVTYVCLVIIQLGRDEVSNFWCVFLAFTVQYTFLASFFWMNVMCFDIWWVFSGFRPPQGSAKEREHKKFLLYSGYAWGVPVIILAISLVMDLAPFIPESFIKPGFGDPKCWFKDSSGALLYYYLPIGVLLMLNITMFVSTACRLRAHTRETKVLHGNESRQSVKADKDRFDLYLKLFVVMGINWVLELVSFFGGGRKSLWYVTDIGNALQGLLIFVIFVCKRRVIRLVSQKLCSGRLISLGSKSGPSQSQSSHTTSTLVSKSASTSNSQ